MSHKIELESPIFSLCSLKSHLIIACGGGAAKFGVKNKLLMYKINGSSFGKKEHEEELGDETPTFLSGFEKIDGFLASVSEFTFVYIIKEEKFEKIFQLQTVDLKREDLFQSCVKSNATLLAAGSSAGELKVYTIEYSAQSPVEIKSISKIGENLTAHLKAINNLEIIIKKKGAVELVVTASGDGTCKVFDVLKPENNKPLRLISKFSFRQKESEPYNYFMRDLIYDEYYGYLYTLQSLQRGKSFLTKWSLQNVNNILPLDTLNVSETTCSSISLHHSKKYIGVTDCEGEISFVNCADMTVLGSRTIGENMIKCGCMSGNYYITGGAMDNTVRISGVKTGSLCKCIKSLFYLNFY